MLVFKGRGKPEYPEKELLGARERTNNILNFTYGVDAMIRTRATIWWEASALTGVDTQFFEDKNLQL